MKRIVASLVFLTLIVAMAVWTLGTAPGKAEMTKIVAPLSSLSVSSGFIPNRSRNEYTHLSTDYRAADGQPVMAIADGTVKRAEYNKVGGYMVDLEHIINGVTCWSRYQHFCKAAIVSVGQKVSAGQTIGYAGNTGSGSEGTHLHIQIFSGIYVSYLEWGRGNFSQYPQDQPVNGPVEYNGTIYYNPDRIIRGIDIIGNPEYDNLEFRNVVYPKTFKIDTRNGWFLQDGAVVSNVNLTSIRSIITRLSDYKDIDDTGEISISGRKYFAIKSIDERVKFSAINTAGKYAWRLIAKDSNGRTLRMVMYFDAVSSGSTSTEKRATIAYPNSDSWNNGEYHEFQGNTSGSTVFYVISNAANSNIYLKSQTGTAIVNQHTMGVYTGQGEETHHGFYYVSVAYVGGQYRHDFVWAPSATTSDGRIELNTEEQLRISFSSAGIFRVEVKPMNSSEASKYWRVDSLDHWKTAAKWYVNTTSNCTLRKDAVKIEFNLPNGNGVPNGNLRKGKSYELRGTVKASESIKSIKGTIYEAGTGKIVSGIGTNPITINPNSTSVDIYTSQINYSLKFNNLKDGMYRYELVVTTASGWTQTVADSTFIIGNSGGVRGDADGNGKFSLNDIMLMIDYLNDHSTKIELANCDMNGDGIYCSLGDIMEAVDLFVASLMR